MVARPFASFFHPYRINSTTLSFGIRHLFPILNPSILLLCNSSSIVFLPTLKISQHSLRVITSGIFSYIKITFLSRLYQCCSLYFTLFRLTHLPFFRLYIIPLKKSKINQRSFYYERKSFMFHLRRGAFRGGLPLF